MLEPVEEPWRQVVFERRLRIVVWCHAAKEVENSDLGPFLLAGRMIKVYWGLRASGGMKMGVHVFALLSLGSNLAPAMDQKALQSRAKPRCGTRCLVLSPT